MIYFFSVLGVKLINIFELDSQNFNCILIFKQQNVKESTYY